MKTENSFSVITLNYSIFATEFVYLFKKKKEKKIEKFFCSSCCFNVAVTVLFWVCPKSACADRRCTSYSKNTITLTSHSSLQDSAGAGDVLNMADIHTEEHRRK